MMNLAKSKINLLIIGLLCLVLTGIWFKDGKLLATGEEGLMLANPARSVELYHYAWNDIGIGESYPGVNVMIPLLSVATRVVEIGLPIWIFQATIFFSLMMMGSFSIYFLTKELFRGFNLPEIEKIAFVAAIFFLFNPVSLYGVWYRFALSFEMFYNFVPLFFYLFLIGLNRKKLEMVIALPLLTLLFSFTSASPALPPLLWFFPFTYCLLLWKRYPWIYLSSMLIIWVLVNAWWIYPFVVLSKYAFASETDLQHAIGTLKANSEYYELGNVIRLIHGGFMYKNETFGSIYKSVPFLALSWLLPLVTVYGLVKLKPGLLKKFFTLNLITLLFLVKGTMPPFGGVFLWLFKHIIFLQAYRNTFEKIGMIMPIVYAPLFSFGLIYLTNKIQNPVKKWVVLMFFLGCLIIYNWPFFTGALVSFGKRDIRVEVPAVFKQANKAIPPGEHRILSIPVMGGASGFYKWPSGYKGVDASEFLFNYPAFTKFYDAKTVYGRLLVAGSSGLIDHNLVGVAQFLSSDLIVVRHDTDLETWGYNLDALERVDKMVKSSNLTEVFQSPELTIWSLPKDKIVPLIYAPKSVRFGESPDDLITALENQTYDPKTELFFCNNPDQCKPNLGRVDPNEIQIIATPESVEYQKISPVEYRVKVANSQSKFLLVFNNNYHPGWEAKAENGTALEHFIANGYANGFIVNNVGNLKISLNYSPQEEVDKSYQISIWAMSLAVAGMVGMRAFRIR